MAEKKPPTYPAYCATSAILCDGVLVKQGDTLSLSDEQAAPLIACGVISLKKGDSNVEPPIN